MMNGGGAERMRRVRAAAVRACGTLRKAVETGALEQFQSVSLSEAVVLGLVNQGVRTFIGIFGHGSTDVGEVLRIYEAEGAVRTVQVRSEVEAAHIASALKWKYGETPAVFTSIGPGALQALAGSLTALSNGLGVYYLLGDETTHGEGPNMQQIPRREQELFLRLTGTMGPSCSIHTPSAVFTALKRGCGTVNGAVRQSPFYMLLPMNVQPETMARCNLLEFPERMVLPPAAVSDELVYGKAVRLIRSASRIAVKAGGGAARLPSGVLAEFLDLIDGVYVHSPNIPGVLPGSHPRNMTVGGAKGSISGNYAMEECDLLIAVGARGVCQWDSSGTAFRKAEHIININVSPEDLAQYNRTLPLQGDAGLVLIRLIGALKAEGIEPVSRESEWLRRCREKRREWEEYKRARYEAPPLSDAKWKCPLLTQPRAVKIAVDFADSLGAVKYFDAGDVQANGFQIVCDEIPGRTVTDTGASYMGFAVSAMLASALAEDGDYPMAFTGDGSFMMNPQILIDGVAHGLRGMIVLFDNRRMAAISGLQTAQYGREFRTDDPVAVDYVRMASSVRGVMSVYGGHSPEELEEALKEAAGHDGLSLVHVPVYYGGHELAGLGAFGRWNVGNWCDRVQKEKHEIGL